MWFLFFGLGGGGGLGGAICEGGHHVSPALSDRPALLFTRGTLEPAPAPGTMGIEREHLLQILEHIVEDSSCSTKVLLLELSLVPVGGLLVGLEVSVKVSLLVGLGMGICLGMGVGMGIRVGVVVVVAVMVVVIVMWLSELVKVFEKVVKVERLEVLVEVGTAAVASLSG